MALTSATVIQALPRLTWRGIYAPYEDASVDFGHRQSPREYYDIPAAGHDWTGRMAHKVSGLLYFVNGVEGYNEAFPKNWNRWRAALFDGSSGDLDHPVLGKFRARVENGSLQVVSRVTAGIVVRASWTETNDRVDQPNKFTDPEPDAFTIAKAAEAAADAYEVRWEYKTLSTSLADAVAALTSSVFDAQVTLSGYANQVKGAIEDMIFRVELIADPGSFAAYDNLIRLWDAVDKLGKKAEQELGRSTAIRITQSETTLDAFAVEVGNEVQDVMGLNPGLLRSPVVAKGVAVTYYTSK